MVYRSFLFNEKARTRLSNIERRGSLQPQQAIRSAISLDTEFFMTRPFPFHLRDQKTRLLSCDLALHCPGRFKPIPPTISIIKRFDLENSSEWLTRAGPGVQHIQQQRLPAPNHLIDDSFDETLPREGFITFCEYLTVYIKVGALITGFCSNSILDRTVRFGVPRLNLNIGEIVLVKISTHWRMVHPQGLCGKFNDYCVASRVVKILKDGDIEYTNIRTTKSANISLPDPSNIHSTLRRFIELEPVDNRRVKTSLDPNIADTMSATVENDTCNAFGASPRFLPSILNRELSQRRTTRISLGECRVMKKTTVNRRCDTMATVLKPLLYVRHVRIPARKSNIRYLQVRVEGGTNPNTVPSHSIDPWSTFRIPPVKLHRI
ncbi:hypothetical protein C8J56DRAFT_1045292 [Mycena floridula]|nr:hypothetical protein C8J56DRAFT_1045292 [Mycena floridula]